MDGDPLITSKANGRRDSARPRLLCPHNLLSLTSCLRRRCFIGFFFGICILYGLFLLQGRFFSQIPNENTAFHVRVQPTARPFPACVRPPASAARLLDSPGCRIPAHEPFSAEVKGFVSDFPSVRCADPPPLVRSNDTHLMLEKGLAAAYNVSSVTCCYTAMWRFQGPRWQEDPEVLRDGLRHGNDIRFAKDCVAFEEPVAVPHEFVRVTCTGRRLSNKTVDNKLYTDYHAFVPLRRPRGHPGGITPREHVSEDALSVLIVGIDSLSRLNMIRKMPKTRAFLEEHLGARSMMAYNKVEDNTFPNLVPLLTGMNIPELRNSCWPEDSAHFDACPWVWKRFNAEGYVNMFAEDTAWMGLFHYLKRGFAVQPTDYDPRPLLYLGEKNLGRGGGFNAKYCIGQRHQIEVLFDYGLKFVRGMAVLRRKFFGLVWGTSLSHDMLNQPDEADDMYARFLGDLEATGLFNSTAVIFMSDHGLRFGSILSTYQGHLENMLPPMYVVLPEWVRRRYPLAIHNLECNRHSLVTVFDLHRTLHNLMDLTSLEQAKVEADGARVAAAFAAKGGTPPRGISLFTPIPAARTCSDAGIPTNYCACQHLSQADPQAPDVQKSANFVVSHINSIVTLACSTLRLDSVLEARKGTPLHTRDLKKEADENEFQVTLRTQPGDALFSATVRHHIKSDRMQLAGSISRLNAYGNSSWCAESTALRPLCHCKRPAPDKAPRGKAAARSDGDDGRPSAAPK
ncbi:uncharacterized protein LOC117652330 isoform X2 [Thrips palmi]|uniref:Uncharacterized protein LOC117652330 isoform X2 n=1 Tax=Thrips palmi TaxID=161013 RepID=A0A6P9A526_THRPL|nr:uncharacterized protein LOC117652330 isoform X2 [Thrips palmi]XP_034253053.1 uncharacterized protein LOC117652330 isoform X2 [Thrips palmi]XP_034253054.1 uncharacterized protein LOC117652330 isoform X2 [Thrips palmi]